MSESDRREKISVVPMFQSLELPLRQELSDILIEVSTERVMESGDVLYERDDEEGNTGAILVEGLLEIRGDDDHLIEVSAPDLVGEIQQFNEFGQRTATVTAKTEAVVLEFPWHEFVSRLNERATISDTDRTEVKKVLATFAGERLKELTD